MQIWRSSLGTDGSQHAVWIKLLKIHQEQHSASLVGLPVSTLILTLMDCAHRIASLYFQIPIEEISQLRGACSTLHEELGQCRVILRLVSDRLDKLRNIHN